LWGESRDKMPSGQPRSGVESASRRAAMLKRAREFFEHRNVLEVDTPVLSRYAVSDPQIENVEVSLQLDPDRPWYLQSSPEYCMKRLLSAGYPDIYEICKVFRDSEVGRYHQPEFTMVEWYRLNFDLTDIMQDTVEFIECLVNTDPFSRPPLFLSYADAFSRFADCNPLTADIETLANLMDADDRLQSSVGQRRDDWLNAIFAAKISGRFSTDRLTVIHHYPASQAALARVCPDDSDVADRFEVFAGTLELANGYVELLDPKEHTDRFEAGSPSRRTDREFIAALEHGLPPCAGVAIGFDRVHMFNEGADDIRQVLTFAFEAGEGNG
ncbi:MAG: EF-P lysine aminoacylase EpmA, partial [Woeseia sp.]